MSSGIEVLPIKSGVGASLPAETPPPQLLHGFRAQLVVWKQLFCIAQLGHFLRSSIEHLPGDKSLYSSLLRQMDASSQGEHPGSQNSPLPLFRRVSSLELSPLLAYPPVLSRPSGQ